MTPVTVVTHQRTTTIVADSYPDGTECYTASDPNLPGCFASGRNPEEAAANLEEARVEYVASVDAEHQYVPSIDTQRAWLNTGKDAAFENFALADTAEFAVA